MRATRTCLQLWKHDIMAGSFAILAMMLLLQLMSRRSAQVTAEPPAATSPVLFGIETETDDRPPQLARTGETEQHAKPQPLPTENAEEQSAEQMVLQEVAQTAENRLEQATPEPSQTVTREGTATAAESTETKNAPSDAQTAENVTPQEADLSPQKADPWVATADNKPEPNNVEAKPKPVEQMTAQEIAEAVAAYEQRIRNGEVRLVVEWVLSPEQLNAVAAYYVVATRYTAIAVMPNGEVKNITAENSIPKGKLIGDLPLERSKWPSQVASKARLHLGGNYVAKTANFLFSNPTALQLYRVLATEVGTDNWQPGSVFVLRLFAADGQVQCKFVRQETSAARPLAAAINRGAGRKWPGT